MKIIINNKSGLPQLTLMTEIVRIMKKGFVVAGNNYQARTIFEGCVIECKRNKKSYSFTVKSL
jgi:hypothetical protein